MGAKIISKLHFSSKPRLADRFFSFLARFMRGGCARHPCRHEIIEKDRHRLLFSQGDGVSFFVLTSNIWFRC